MGWHRETARSFHHRGKLQLHASKGEPQNTFLLLILIIVLMLPVIVIAPIDRVNDHGTAQIGSQPSREEKLPFWLHSRLFGQIGFAGVRRTEGLWLRRR